MATGISKTKWNNNNLPDHAEAISKTGLEVCLKYEGKIAEAEILDFPPAKCVMLGKVGEEINSIYYGDNLEILALLLQKKEVKNQVKLIYIDPPFATKSIFKSRLQADAYCDLLAGSHYIEFIRQRLIILREILADDGSIYVHLDENMAFYIKVIMDEVFGSNNFRNWITRKKCNPKNFTSKTYGDISDYIMFYTKSNNYIWNRPFEEWTDERAKKEYTYIEKETGRRYKKVPLHAPGTRNGETGKPWRGMNPPEGKHWQFPPQKLDEMDARGDIYWSKNGNPRRKVYFDESSGVSVQDIWLDYRDAHNQNIKITGYPTEKNPDLLGRIIQTSSNQGDLVLDCFSGSGTTLAVASQLGRKWIGIDNSSEAIATTLRRFAKGCELMGDFVNNYQNESKSKLTKDHQQLSLFELGSFQSNLINESPSTSNYITQNFALYAVESSAGDLESIIKEWKKW